MSRSSYRPPEPIGSRHDLSAFRCRSSEQTEWLRRYARQSASASTTRVFVVTEHGSDRVIAYYAWRMAQINPVDATVRLRKGAGRYPQPVALLARLGVDLDHERRGLGAALLQDVLARLLELSDEIGCRALLVHAESDEARDFYLRLLPELEPSPTDDLHLLLLMKDIRRTLKLEIEARCPARGSPVTYRHIPRPPTRSERPDLIRHRTRASDLAAAVSCSSTSAESVASVETGVLGGVFGGDPKTPPPAPAPTPAVDLEMVTVQ